MSLKKILRKKFSIFKEKKSKQLTVISQGKDNNINIHPEAKIHGEILIFGNNNHINLGKISGNFNLYIGSPDCLIERSTLSIGNDTTSNGLGIRLSEHGSTVLIGEKCMFSSGIQLWASDTHSILDKTGKLINLGQFVKIGNSVWIGMDCKIGKNTQISDNSIVGWGSVVTKKFTEAGVIIAGNPAQIVKRDIHWSAKRPNQYLHDETKSSV